VSLATRVLNRPEGVALATDKIGCFRRLAEVGVPVPPFWTTKEEVDRKGIVLARTKVRGSGGEGIVVVRDGDTLPDAPLYTGYIRKDAEYRIHVALGKVIAVQQKRRDSEAEQTPDQKLIRNHDNGWVFAVNNVVFRDDKQRQACEHASINAVAGLGLDFGAVDLVVARKTGQPYVLEVNTAPGIESPTILEAYRAAFAAEAGGK
jgi:glutathione synthase/RimK-type ligase-like ATP-grasp enzyme